MRKKIPKSTSQETPFGVTAGLDRQLVGEAYAKVLRGEKPTKVEKAALARFEKKREEKLRWAYYAAIPQKHWRKMSGRQAKVLGEQADRYGLPFGGPVVNLPDVVRALHDFLAENAQRLACDDGMIGAHPPSPALERYREERAALARLDRLEREGTLLSREGMHTSLTKIAAILRSAGERLQRVCGTEAADILNEALDDAEAYTEQYFADREKNASDLE